MQVRSTGEIGSIKQAAREPGRVPRYEVPGDSTQYPGKSRIGKRVIAGGAAPGEIERRYRAGKDRK